MRVYKSGSIAALVYVLTLVHGCSFESSADESMTKGNSLKKNKINKGIAFDLEAFILKEVKSGKKRVVIPPGRHRVKPVKRNHLLLANLNDIEIIADGVEMICTETTRAISIHNCKNLTIKGLSIDYDPLPFTQGKITRISDDKLTIDITLFDGYPSEGISTSKFEIFDSKTNELRFGSYFDSKIKIINKKQIRVIKSGRFAKNNLYMGEKVGDIAVLDCNFSPGGKIPHAIYMQDSENIVLEDVTVFGSNCFSYLEVGCNSSIYKRCHVARRPQESDLKKRGYPRLRSGNADAFHSKGAEKGPAIIECSAMYMGDDAVAVNGHYDLITESKGKVLRVLAKREMEIKVGDTVEILSYEGKRLKDAKVISIKAVGSISQDERKFLKKQRMDSRLKDAKKMLKDAYSITLDREVQLSKGSMICPINKMGNGFLIKNCIFGNNRSRGILIKGSNGKITGNKLTGSWGEAIKIAPEFWWLEAGSSSDIEISNNHISDCKSVAIAVYSFAGDLKKISPAGSHYNISVTDNTISSSPKPGILITSTDGLVLKRNKLNLTKKAANFRLLKKHDPVVIINSKNIERD